MHDNRRPLSVVVTLFSSHQHHTKLPFQSLQYAALHRALAFLLLRCLYFLYRSLLNDKLLRCQQQIQQLTEIFFSNFMRTECLSLSMPNHVLRTLGHLSAA
jgi:hypothetical protein